MLINKTYDELNKNFSMLTSLKDDYIKIYPDFYKLYYNKGLDEVKKYIDAGGRNYFTIKIKHLHDIL